MTTTRPSRSGPALTQERPGAPDVPAARRSGAVARTLAGLLAVALALLWSVLFMGLIDLAVPVDRTPGFYDAYLLETGWGVLLTLLVAVPLLVLVVRPLSTGATAELLVVAAAVALAALATPSARHLLLAAALLAGTAGHRALARRGHRLADGPADTGRQRLLGRSGHRQVDGAGRSPSGSRTAWALAVVGAVAALPYGLDMLAAAREGRYPVDVTNGLDHWPVQAALAVAVPAVAALAAARPDGWRVPAWTAAAAAGWTGAVSLVHPEHAGSLGQAGGAAAVAWGVLLATHTATEPRG